MAAAKRKISVSLDAELVRGDEALSKQVNDAVREAMAARRRGRLLEELLAELEEREGALPNKLMASSSLAGKASARKREKRAC